MPTYLDISRYVTEYKLKESLDKVFKAEKVQKFVISAIKRRLYAQGITGSDLKLKTDKGNPFYTDAYIKVKKRKGQKVSNVTLYLSGGFYESFKFILIDSGWRIDADWGYVGAHFKELYNSEAEFQQDVMSLNELEIDTMFRVDIAPEIKTDFHETVYRP